MKRAGVLASAALFLMACGLLQGLSQVKEGVEFYATQLPQTLESQRPTLEAAVTQAAGTMQSPPGTPAPTIAGPSQDAEGQGGPTVGRMSEWEEVRSGRESFARVLTVGEQTFTLLEWVHEFDRKAQAEAWTIRRGNEPEERIVLREGTMWYTRGDQWMQMQIDPKDIQPALLSTFASGMNEVAWQRVGEETVNGIPTVRYRSEGLGLPPSALETINLPGFPALAQAPQVNRTVAEVWVTPEGYLVKGELRWEMTFTLLDGRQVAGSEALRWEIRDVNQPVTIEAPEGVGQEVALPLPLPPEATLVSHINEPPTWMYNVPSWDVAQAVGYLEGLTGQGYQVVERFVSDALARFVLQAPDGRQWEVSVTPAMTGSGVTLLLRPWP